MKKKKKEGVKSRVDQFYAVSLKSLKRPKGEITI